MLRERVRFALIDARYAVKQLRRFSDTERAADAMDRVVGSLEDLVNEE